MEKTTKHTTYMRNQTGLSIYQKHINTSQSSSEFQSIPANDEVKVLQIAPSHPQLVDWVKEYGQGKIKCESVSASSFNRNPNVVWDYDVIVFGFADCNGGYDLNQNSRDVVEKYIKSGKGVLFGHDTINDYIGHVYFDSLASYANLTLEPISGSYQNEIRIAKKGLLTNYPYMIGEVGDKLRVPTSHISRQVPHGDVWMLFNGDNTCYLTTWNNCALIQTGHSGGAATQDEQKLLMNTIYYLAQRTSKTSWIDHMGQDLSEPLIPEMVTIKPNNQNNTLFINVSAKDQGDDYQYYVESTHPDDGEIKQSNIESIHLESGIKGYSIVIDTKADTVPDDEIETTNGCYELKLPEKDNDQDNYYIHVKAIDNANNISQVLHYEYSKQEIKDPALKVEATVSEVNDGKAIVNVNYANEGEGTAKNVKIKFSTQDGAYLMDVAQDEIEIPEIISGTKGSIEYAVIFRQLLENQDYNYYIDVNYENEDGSKTYNAKLDGILTVAGKPKEQIGLDYVLYASELQRGLTLSGWKCNIQGDIYTGGDFTSQMSELYVAGKIDTVGKTTIYGWKKEVGAINEKVDQKVIPDLKDAIYDTAGEYVTYEADHSYIQDKNIIDKSIKVNGNVSINGTQFEGNCTIIASGDIDYNVMSFSGNGNVCLYSESGNININGSQIEVNGLLYAPNGKVTINAYDTTINGAVYANNIFFNGSIFNVNKDNGKIQLESKKSSNPKIYVSLPSRAEIGKEIVAKIIPLNEIVIEQYKVETPNGELLVSKDGSFSFIMPERENKYHIIVYGYDAKGRYDKKEYDIQPYKIVPEVSVKASKVEVEENEPAQFDIKLSHEDNIVSIKYALNGKEVNVKNLTYVLDTSNIGEYTLEANVITKTGNTYKASDTIKVISKDKEAPIVKAQFDKVNYYEGDNAIVTLSVTDNVGVVGTKFICNDKQYEYIQGKSIELDNLKVGNNKIQVTAWDAAGNIKEQPYTIVVYAAEPTIVINVSSEKVRQGEKAYFGVVTTGKVESSEYTLNGDKVNLNEDGRYELDTSKPGNYIFKGKITSDIGKSYVESAKIMVEGNEPIDDQPPEIKITLSKEQALVNEKVNAVIDVQDDIGVEEVKVYINNELAMETSGEITFSYNHETTVEVKVIAKDTSGNESIKTVFCQITDTADKVTPIARILSPAMGITTDQAIKIVGTAKDDIQFKKYILEYAPVDSDHFITFAEGNEAKENEVLGIFKAEKEGTYQIRLIVEDASGNSAYTITTYIWGKAEGEYDLIPPTAIINTPALGTNILKPTEIIGSVHDDIKLKRYILQYAPVNSEEFITFAEGNEEKENELLGTFDPTGLEKGTYQVRLTAEDVAGNLYYVTTTYIVGEQIQEKPILILRVSQNAARIGDVIKIQAGITNGVPVKSVTVYVDGQPITLENNIGTFKAIEAKILNIEAVAVTLDDEEIREKATCQIFDAEDKVPPEAVIISPEMGMEISAPVDIVGTAKDDKEIARYYLQYRLKGTEDYTIFAEDIVAKENEVLGTFDPTLLENGLYEIQLVVEDKGGNFTNVTVEYAVSGKMKIGQMSLGFTDVVAHLAGATMTVNRNYNSFNKKESDFGYGWSLDINNIRLTESHILGDGWQQVKTGQNISTMYGLKETIPHEIKVTYGDGTSDIFAVDLNPSGQLYMPLQVTDVAFCCKTNKNVKLEIVGNCRVQTTGNIGPVTLYDYDSAFEEESVFDPQVFQLTKADGSTYIIDKDAGVQKIIDRNGNNIDVSKDLISMSNGQSLTFERDEKNRICNIVEFNGNTTHYVYDDNGDLVEVINPLGQTVTFRYDEQHNIQEIIDPRGVAVARNEYDEEGRLLATIDAKGNRTEYRHDIEGRQEIIKDVLGNVTLLVYDEKGNILQKTDPNGLVTENSYDENGNLLTQVTSGDGIETQTVRYTYNIDNLVDSVTAENGNRVSIEYDQRSNVLSMKDIEKNIINYTYDC